MIAVIFEVELASGQQQRYLELAAELRPLLDEADGFISIERFQSLAHNGRILSLSFWRDEAAVTKWRRLEQHRFAQSKGRSALFDNYRLRVAGVLRDYGMYDRCQAPADAIRDKKEMNI